MKAAAIDIGTNSVLLLVCETTGNKFEVLCEEQRLPRLGKGVDKGRKLSQESIDRTLNVLEEYRHILEKRFPEVGQHVEVTATSAARDASNREQFLQEVFEHTGWKVRLLSGREEAELTYKGSLSMLEIDEEKKCFVLDIGGGSTEFAFGRGSTLRSAFSLDMGCVRFTERFLSGKPPDDQEIKSAERAVRKMVSGTGSPEKSSVMIGVAGTVTALAGVEMGLDNYDAERLNGYVMTRESIQKIAGQFSDMHPNQIEEQFPLFMNGRGEVIMAGLIILLEVMQWSGHDRLVVSTGGIQHGAIAEKYLA